MEGQHLRRRAALEADGGAVAMRGGLTVDRGRTTERARGAAVKVPVLVGYARRHTQRAQDGVVKLL